MSRHADESASFLHRLQAAALWLLESAFISIALAALLLLVFAIAADSANPGDWPTAARHVVPIMALLLFLTFLGLELVMRSIDPNPPRQWWRDDRGEPPLRRKQPAQHCFDAPAANRQARTIGELLEQAPAR